MNLAENKYKAMVENSTWAAPDEQAAQIIALQAQVKKLSKTAKGKGKGKKGGNKDKSASTTKANDAPKTESTTKTKKERPAWMTKAPADGKPKTKEVNGKTYHWCPTHKAWGVHKASDCKGLGFRRPVQDPGKTIAWDGKAKAPTLKMAQALHAIAGNDLEDDSEG
jgi:hypothetical protein